jgi:hypothetical protein
MTNNKNQDQSNQENKNQAGQSSHTTNRGQSTSQSNHEAMTPEEAGHLGGTAPHSCRGLQCEEENDRKNK